MTKFITRSIAALGVVAGIGIAALPAMSYAVDTKDVAITLTVDPTVSGDASICPTDPQTSVTAGQYTTMDCAFSFSANSAMSLTIVDSDTDTSLKNSKGTGDSIAAFGAPIEIAELETTSEGWGFTVTGLSNITASGNYGTHYTGVPAKGSVATIATTSGAVTDASGTVKFGVKTSEDNLAGDYMDTVTISITPTV